MDINWDLILKLGAPIGVVITWLTKDRILAALNIKQEKNSATKGNLENVQIALDLWQEMLEDAVKRHKSQIAELEAVIEKIKQDLARLQTINEALEAMVDEQKEMLNAQREELNYYKTKKGRNE